MKKSMRACAGVLQVALVVVLVAGVSLAAGHTQQQKPPIKLGTSGSNVKDINSQFCCVGTLGSLVTKNGKQFILSNNHVLGLSNTGQVGQAIMQRGYVDTVPVCSKNGTINVAKLSQFIKLDFTGKNNLVDAAIAQVLPGKVSSTGAILQVGNISSTTVDPKLNLSVEKSGRTTGLTQGTISSVNVSVTVSGYGECGLGTDSANFVKQFIVSGNNFSAGGDSGSLILNRPAQGKLAQPVGLLFAGNGTETVGNPIKTVLSKLGATMVGTPSDGAQEANALDAEIERVSQIKDRNDDYLMHLPGVMAHGVSLSQDGSGRVVIRLFLKDASNAASLPAMVEGVPLETQVSGAFHTQPNCAKVPGK